MMRIETRPKSEMPPRYGDHLQLLREAISALNEGEALFVPNDSDVPLKKLQMRLAHTYRSLGYSSRKDKDKNGIWIFKEGGER